VDADVASESTRLANAFSIALTNSSTAIVHPAVVTASVPLPPSATSALISLRVLPTTTDSNAAACSNHSFLPERHYYTPPFLFNFLKPVPLSPRARVRTSD